jgi:hypothetical protein
MCQEWASCSTKCTSSCSINVTRRILQVLYIRWFKVLHYQFVSSWTFKKQKKQR